MLLKKTIISCRNAVHARNLQDFLSTECRENNPYKYYQAFLLDYDTLPVMSITLNPQYVSNLFMYIPTNWSNIIKVTAKRGCDIIQYGVVWIQRKGNSMIVIYLKWLWDVCSVVINN